jgi:23S rRNA pseudouridine2604 synthase
MSLEEGVRLNKFLSEAGICSRREADRRVAAGQVLINGQTALMGQKVLPGDCVEYCGKMVATGEKDEAVLLLVNKPVGIVCTAEKREKHNIVDFIHYPIRLYPVGRLDKNSRGLLLMTNQGELVNRILRSRYFHEKEYIVRVDRPVTAAFIRDMSSGVYLPELEVTTRKCRVQKLSKFTFRIVLTQGLNRQIRRMCSVFGYQVRDLQRVRILNLNLGDLPEGAYRSVSAEEYRELLTLLEKC